MSAEFVKVNSLMVTGRCGSEAKWRDVGDNQACEVSIAIDKKGKKVDGEWKNESFWLSVKIMFWSDDKRQGLKDRMKDIGKGDLILVDGTLSEESWEDKQSGTKRSKSVLEANNVQIVKKKGDGKSSREESGDNSYNDRGSNSKQKEPEGEIDIPF